MNRFVACVTIFLIFSFADAFAQHPLSTKSKKAIEYYTLADNYRVRGHYQQAVELLQKAIKKDDEFVEAYLRMGLVYRMANNLTLAQRYYEEAQGLVTDAKWYSRLYLDLGDLYLQIGEYSLSVSNLEKYMSLVSERSKYYSRANQLLDNARFATLSIENAEKIDIRPLSDTVNQFAVQYFPVLTADQEKLFFTRRLGIGPNFDEDLVVSTKDSKNNWSIPTSISDNINSELNEGTCTISANGRTLIFTSCHGRKGYGSCDLFISRKNGDKWTVPENMGNQINSSAWDSQPSLSADGRILYFVSTRGGGLGGQDIWVSYIDVEGEWSIPSNLGNSINTQGNEISPFIHANNQVLYFASNGHLGMGGYDIYYSNKKNNAYDSPVNIGYPINNGQDQLSLFITADGQKGYYSYEDGGGINNSSKLYEFDIPKSLQVERKSNYIKGRILDSLTKEPLYAQIELYDTEKGQLISLTSSDSISGEYLVVLTQGAKYALYVQSSGYLFKSYRFEFDQNKNVEPLHRDIYLAQLTKGAVTELNNIFFKHDDFQLDDRSKTELDRIGKFLESNPSLQVEIAGHTDNIGSSEYNLQLSLQRANSVYLYLIGDKNIPQTRLSFAGYGDKFPKVSNSTEKNRGINRRIEFKIL